MSPSSSVQSSKLLPQERQAAISLSTVYCARMLGLFIILPVFAVSASQYEHSTPILIGMALGIYGLLQAMLQIPFGMLSDRIGRKPVIIAGLGLFFLGSVLAAVADSIYWVIAGRALQGAGAISAALIALAADLTRDEQRTKMMATLGGSIGFAFVLSLILGPILVSAFSLSGVFWFTAITALCTIALVIFKVPTPVRSKISGDTVASTETMRGLLGDRQLLRLDVSIFVLHALLTATFVGVPAAIVEAGMDVASHWQVYLPALLISVAVMIPMIIIAEKHRKLRFVFLTSIFGIAVALGVLRFGLGSIGMLFLGMTLFFCFLNTLEALLPSLVSKLAPPGAKGSAMGIYSSAQFLGAFAGGVGGGWIFGSYGLTGLCSAAIILCMFWGAVAWGLQNPKSLSSYLFTVGEVSPAEGLALAESCLSVDGVEDAVVVPAEGLAYLKVDRKLFDASELDSISLPASAG